MIGNEFNQKVCWITGASSGIGAALALQLSRLNAILILSSRDASPLENVKKLCAYPDRVTVFAFDMEETQMLPDIAMRAWNTHREIHFVFLNAGFAVRDTTANTRIDLVEKVMRVNFFGAVAITKTLLPLMQERKVGAFVVTSSLSGKFGIPKLGAYAASKHALHGFFDSLRAELTNDEIRITIVIPGLVRTNISVKALTGEGTVSGKMQEAIANGITPDECARKIIHAVANGKKEVVIGGIETYSVLLNRLFPRLFASLIRSHPLRRWRALSLKGKARKR